MHELLHITNLIWAYVTLHKNAILAIVGGSAGLWVVVQTVLVKLKINGPKLSFAISHIAAFLTALATYWLSSSSPNVGITYGWLWVALESWHHLVLNPNYNKYFVPFLSWLNTVKNPTTVAPVVTPTTLGSPVNGSSDNTTFA